MTVITMPDGSKWHPASSTDTVECKCGERTLSQAEVDNYPSGTCSECGEAWTGSEKRSTSISVTAPTAISGET